MTIDFHKSFHKHASPLKPAQKKRLKEALRLFAEEPYHTDLYNHSLAGQWKGYRSISFGGGWRAVYQAVDKQTVLFITLGTHSQLYK